MEALVRSTALRGYEELTLSLGGDAGQLLSRFRISVEMASSEDAFVPIRSVAALHELSAQVLNCPDFGLRLAKRQGADILGPIAVLIRNADSISSALLALTRYLQSHSPALHLSVGQPDHRSVPLMLDIIEPSLHQAAQIKENGMGIGLHILRLLGGSAIRPLSAHLPHEPLSDEKTYRDFFGCPVYFNQPFCGMVLPLEFLGQKIRDADPEVNRLAKNYLESQLSIDAGLLSERVAQLIKRLLPTGQCRIETVAEHFCLHKRTLQRTLVAEGQGHFEDLLDRERHMLAARYLAQKRLSLAQITGLLGYAEQSTFNRACRRWFGMPPRSFRLITSQSTTAQSAAQLPQAAGHTLQDAS